MRRIVVVLASVALAVGLLFSGTYSGISADLRKAVAQATPTQPNIVFILTDDMRKDDLRYMPKTRTLLEREGMSFENAFVSNALCAPSRATILTGPGCGPTLQPTALLRASVVGRPTRQTVTRTTTWPPACRARVTGPGSSASI